MNIEDRIKYLEAKKRHHKKLRAWYKKPWGALLVFAILILISFLVFSSIYIYRQVMEINYGMSRAEHDKEIVNITKAIKGPGNNYSKGLINAKVQLIIFSDYSCEFCLQAEPLLDDLSFKYGDDLRIVFRNYPVLQNSINLALAAECAGEQAKFWEMNKSLFNNQALLSNFNGLELNNKLKSLASDLDLDEQRFAECLDNQKYLYKIHDDFSDAEFLGVSGTPTMFINNYKIPGIYPVDNYYELIDGLLPL